MASGNRSLLVALGCVVAAIAAFLFWQYRSESALDSGSGQSASTPSLPGKAAPEAGSAVATTEARREAAPDRMRIEGALAGAEGADTGGGTIVLRGRLVAAQGGPALASEPLEYEVLPGDGALRLGPGNRAAAPKPTPVKTEADGRFAVRVPKGKPGVLRLQERRVVFRRDQDDSPRPDTVATKAHDADHDLGDLAVVAAASISGTVLEKGGQPIADATVRLMRAGTDFLELGLWLDSGDKTDAQGRFAVSGLGARRVGLQVHARGHVPRRIDVDLGPGEQKSGVVIELDAGLAIVGTVVDDTGKPIQGASIAAQRKSVEGAVQIQTTRGGSSTKSDAGGSFVLTGLDDPVVTLNASAKGYQRIRQEDVQAGVNDLVLKLPRCGAIEGVLVDAEGRGVAGSEIHAAADGEHDIPLRFLQTDGPRTGADGKFVVENVVPGTVAIHAEGDQHRPTEIQKIEVLPGQTYKGLRLVAQRGVTVAALVLDAKGEPVEGAKVEVRRPAPEGAAQGAGQPGRRVTRRISRSSHQDGDQDLTHGLLVGGEPEVLGTAKTGKDGKAKVGGLPAGQVVVAASHKSFADAKALALTLPAAGVVDASLSVTRGGSAEIAVIDADRAPVDTELQIDGPLGPEQGKPRTVHTDDKGVAKVERLAPGRYAARMVVSPAPTNLGGGAMVVMGSPDLIEESRKEFTVTEDATVQVTLVQPLMATLVGTVTDLAGPVQGVGVEVTRIDGDKPNDLPAFLPQKHGKSDASGHFKVEGLLPGKYQVSYGKKSALVKHEETVTVQSGQREVEKNLALHGSTVQVAVLSALDDQPLRRAKVTIKKASGDKKAPQRRQVMMMTMSITSDGSGDDDTTSMTTGDTAVQTDDEGKAVLKDLPPGRYEVEVEHGKHAPHKVPAFELGADASLDLGTVKLTAGGSISGAVKMPEGGAEMFFPTVQVALVDGKPGDWQRVPAMQGKFKKPGLAPGKYKLRASDPSQSPDPSQERFGPEVVVEVKAGETSKVTLELPR